MKVRVGAIPPKRNRGNFQRAQKVEASQETIPCGRVPARAPVTSGPEVVVTVSEIWRYPVKTMAGERLERATITPFGIEGDRVVHVEDSRGRVVTSRTHPRLLAHRGTLAPDGEPLVDGQPWSSRGVLAQIVDIAGVGARLVRYDGNERFDKLPLLVLSDGAVKAFGYDCRRLRPNVVIGGVEGMSERDWPGGYLRMGTVLIGVDALRTRCIMTSFDPDTQVQDTEVTQSIFRRFGGKLALDCFVMEGGEVELGDEVELLRPAAPSSSAIAV